MIREVDLVDYYLPQFMQKYKEPVAALNAAQPELVLIWNAVDKVLYNHFISTADEYGITRFEKMLGIYPSIDDTLESRRSRVQSRWVNTIPYTWKVLLQKLEVLCSDTDFILTHDFEVGYTITLITDLELYGQVEELENIINTMLPETIVVNSINNIPCLASGEIVYVGGVCVTNSFFITPDDRYVNTVQGSMNIGSALIDRVDVVLTGDFQEAVTIHGSQNVAVGITVAEIISTGKEE